MRSFKFGNLAVLTLSVVVLLIMVSYTFGAVTPPSLSSSFLTHAEKRELRQHKRAAKYDAEDEEIDHPNFRNGGGPRRKGWRRNGGRRNRVWNRRRDGLGEQYGEPRTSTNSTTACECGKKLSMRLVGGEPTERDAFPWQAALIGKSDKFLCGGSLINNMYVLTAAHCVENFTNPSNVTVRLREYNLNTTEQPEEIMMAVAEIIIHEGYESLGRYNDIALLKFKTKVELPGTPLVTPVCLPSTKTEEYVGKKATATGWGAMTPGGPLSNVLQKVVLKIETNADCKAAGIPNKKIKKTMICAGKKKSKGICNGDSGGPLVYQTAKGNYEQIGISSSSSTDCGVNAKLPSVFTRVNKYLRWIQSKTKDATYCSG